jgi:anaerobic magnesium-protoporphyrin IX monomethyl ester cyclase
VRIKILFVNSGDTNQNSLIENNISIYPNLGLLTLMSALNDKSNVKLGYLDGTIIGNQLIQRYINDNSSTLEIICFSVFSSNFGISIEMAKKAKELNYKIITIFGNDHFSSLYQQIMNTQKCVDYGFYGNDIVRSFAEFVNDILTEKLKPFKHYAGLVYRSQNDIIKNLENPSEYTSLPFVKYNLTDTIYLHQESYLNNQKKIKYFNRNKDLRSQIIDIGRGCIKFSGRRKNNIPENACDFCAIIPGQKSITMLSHKQSWDIIRNAYDQGFNHLFITADELPMTMWNLLKEMSNNIPTWVAQLSKDKRPKLSGYARAEGFLNEDMKIDVLINKLGFDHFYIGLDGLSEVSLKLMNKHIYKKHHQDLLACYIGAIEKIVRSGCLISAGIVVNHLGITKNILEENYNKLVKIIAIKPSVFEVLDFGPLHPRPGSHSFQYLIDPEYAQKRAKEFGLKVNMKYLNSIKDKYISNTIFDKDEIISDFIIGCCPEISQELLRDHIDKISELANKHKILKMSSSLHHPVISGKSI